MTTAIDFKKNDLLLRAAPGMYRHKGDAFPGLYLNVGKTKSTWYIKRRVNGKTKSIKVGAFPALNATKAFKQGDTKTGVAKSDIQTVRDGWTFWCDTSQAQGGMSDDHRHRMSRQLEMHAKEIMESNVADVTSADVQAVLNRLMADGKKATARAVRIGIGNSFNFAPVVNPVAQKKTRVAKSEETEAQWTAAANAHDLDADDWSVIWEAIMARREKNVIIGTAVAVMFLTGIRSENVCSLSWDQVDLQNKTIHLTKMKNKLARTLPVMDTVIDMLKEIRGSGSEWVFPASSATGYITDPKGTFAQINDEDVRVFLPHDGRRHFMQASAEAFLPDYVAHFLRGDKKAGEGSDMLMKYLKRMGNRRAVEDIEKVYFERIKVEPSF
jgi:integrase